MNSHDYAQLSAVEIARQVRAREISACEATTAALAALDAAEPRIHAFATVAREDALRAAEAIDVRIARADDAGPLAAVPVAFKDLVLTKGLRTTFGSRLHADFLPEDHDLGVAPLTAA